MNWNDCPDVEIRPGVHSGAPVVRGTRIPADAILANAEDGYTPDEIATELFEALPVEAVRRIIRFAKAHGLNPA